MLHSYGAKTGVAAVGFWSFFAIMVDVADLLLIKVNMKIKNNNLLSETNDCREFAGVGAADLTARVTSTVGLLPATLDYQWIDIANQLPLSMICAQVVSALYARASEIQSRVARRNIDRCCSGNEISSKSAWFIAATVRISSYPFLLNFSIKLNCALRWLANHRKSRTSEARCWPERHRP